VEPITETLILSGTWLYAEEVEKEVHVIKSNFKPGSGDYEDPLEIQNDQYGEFYDVRIGEYSSDRVPYGGFFTSVAEAMRYAAKVCPSLKWSKKLKVT